MIFVVYDVYLLAQQCSLTSVEGILASVMFTPEGCESTFNPATCRADYTCTSPGDGGGFQLASCNCTRDDRGQIECLSDDVQTLITSCTTNSAIAGKV